MNILQINNAQCAPMSANDNTGINRVVTALCDYYVNSYNYTCFHAYFQTNPNGQSEVFTKGLKLEIPLNEVEFQRFLVENKIDIIVINVSVIDYVRTIPQINAIAHECDVKTIYCFHFMPGYETRSYADFSMAYYSITHNTNIVNTIKKWLITISQPLSSKIICKNMRDQYAQPLNSCDNVVVFTQSYIQQYLHVTQTTQREKFSVIPNPLSFSSSIRKEELAKKEKEVIVVGRLYEHQKRLSYALKVWKIVEQNSNLKDWKLTLIGDGTSKSYYQWLAKKYKLKNISFMGKQDPLPFYQRASILLSTSAYEGWPMVLMECMPMGVVPCVFNSYGAATEIIDNNINGLITPDNDIKTFAANLEDVMLNDTKRTQMAEAAIEKSNSFNMEIVGKRWTDLFSSLLTK